MYGKIFASMYEGSLYGHWQAIVTFQQMIVLADRTGIVDMTPQAMAARTSIPLDIIQTGLAILEQPDEYSRSGDNGGRRIERIDPTRPWGWQIVNYLHYRELASQDDKRRKDRERIAAKRQTATGCDMSQGVADVAHADADADADVSLPTGENVPPRSGRQAGKKASRMCPPDWEPSEKLTQRIEAEGIARRLAEGGTSVEMELERLRSCTFGTARTDWDATAWNWLLTECKKINQREAMYGAGRQARR